MKSENIRHRHIGLKIIFFFLLTAAVLMVLYKLNSTPAKSGETLSGSHFGSGVVQSNSEKAGAEADGLLLLVNPWNPLPEGYEPELTTLSDGTQVAEYCAEALTQMLDDCRLAGNEAVICSGYRTQDTQQWLYDNKISRLIEAGVPQEDAAAEAAKVVAYPGTSEHQTGLAVDITDSAYTALDEGQEQTSTQQWLMENSWKYGFILRYPTGKSDVTGIIYEPWHYRYVGTGAAAEIHELGLCLEEYLEYKNGAG